MHEDITEKKLIEMELEKERTTLKNIIELNPYAIEIKDVEGRHVSANKAFIDMFKSVPPPEYSIFEDPNLKKIGILDEILSMKAGKVLKIGEHWFNPRDSAIESNLNLDEYPSSLICHKVVAFPILGSEGKIENYVMMYEDITKRKKAEQKLEESEQLYRHLFNNTPYAIWLVDLRGKIIDCNETMNNFMSVFKHTDLIGKSFKDVLKMFLREGDPRFENLEQVFKDRFKILLKQGYLEPIEFEISRGDGKPFWITLESSFVHVGKERLIQVFIKEITERKKADQLIMEREKLKEVNKLKSEFLRRTSHELKTPLISIKGFAQLILSLYESELNSDVILKLGEITDGCERLQNLINNLLKTSRLESPVLKPKLQMEDLSFLIKFCVHELESLAETRNQSIKLEIHNKLYASFEKEEIHDVLSNLLNNAIKYTPPMGKIEVKTELKDNYVVVSVKDNGIGFTADQKKKIFQQFGKIDRHGQGLDLGIDSTGLGLYISKKIVEAHGGKIWMESEGKNKGTSFYFTLPIVK